MRRSAASCRPARTCGTSDGRLTRRRSPSLAALRAGRPGRRHARRLRLARPVAGGDHPPEPHRLRGRRRGRRGAADARCRSSAAASGLDVPLVGGRARAALEREKTLVLRSIKELEFDHAMGKVSDEDFAEMARPPARARRGPDAPARRRRVLLGADRARAGAAPRGRRRGRRRPPARARDGSARSAAPPTTPTRGSARQCGHRLVPA